MNEHSRETPRHQPYRTFGQRRVVLNLMFIGDSSAGRSSIIRRFVNGTFDKFIYPKIIYDFLMKNVSLNCSDIKLRLWDTFGSEPYRGYLRSQYRHSHSVIIVYDVTDMNTFTNIENVWLKNIEENGTSDLAVMIVGTKCDLQGRQVDYVTAKKFADRLNIPLMEVSSLTGYGIDRAIMSAVVMALEKNKENASSSCESEYVYAKRTPDTGCQLS